MNFLFEWWNTFLYVPLLNALVYLYNGVAGENIVWAVVWLTIVLRIVLLPLSVISEKNQIKFESMKNSFDEISKKFKNDAEQKKIEIRKLLKRHKFSPWAKVVVLLIQILVFVLLYQVFLGGVRGKISSAVLYDAVALPYTINTDFYGYNAAERSFTWAFAVAVVLIIEIVWEQRKNKEKITKNHLYYMVLFPGSVCFFLWLLPMVKSVFVLTTLFFSAMLTWFLGMTKKRS